MARVRRLDASESRYRTLFFRSQDSVVHAKADGTILEINHAAVDTLGFMSADEVRDIKFGTLFAHPEGLDEVVQQLIAKGSVKHRFAKLKRQDGREIVVAGSSVGQVAPSGELSALLMIFRDVTKEHQKHEELLAQARRDPLTRLPNRRLFEEKLAATFERMQRFYEPAAVMVLDLDGFKEINDNHGHPIGDSVLKAIADRMASVVRKVDTLARLGGDEFAVIHFRPTPGGARRLAQRLIQSVEEPIISGGQEFHVSACVGIALCIPNGDYEGVVERADRALYAAKARGRGEFELDLGR